jgi:hypothetical protein
LLKNRRERLGVVAVQAERLRGVYTEHHRSHAAESTARAGGDCP